MTDIVRDYTSRIPLHHPEWAEMHPDKEFRWLNEAQRKDMAMGLEDYTPVTRQQAEEMGLIEKGSDALGPSPDSILREREMILVMRPIERARAQEAAELSVHREQMAHILGQSSDMQASADRTNEAIPGAEARVIGSVAITGVAEEHMRAAAPAPRRRGRPPGSGKKPAPMFSGSEEE
jgi:hypothetical protein